MIPYIRILKALSEQKVEYLVAGGVAVNLHQINRATVDLDLIVHLTKKNVAKLAKVMSDLGLVPKVPVDPTDLGIQEKREQWIKEKGMIVFSFVNTDNPMELIDIFVNEPKPFQEMFKKRKDIKAFNIIIPVLGIEDLLDLKLKAGRDKDAYDISLLKKKLDQ